MHRNYKFSEVDHQCIRALLWLAVNEDPTRKLNEFVRELHEAGYNCSRETVRCIFHEWRWSWKRPSFKQLNKYTEANIERYQNYIDWILEQNLLHVKFVDEVHFVNKGMYLKNDQ